MKQNRFPIFCVILSLAFLSIACSGLAIFDGNTKRDRRDYGLEQQANYRKTKTLNKVVRDEKEAEILYRLQADDKRNGKVLKKNNTETKELFY